MKIKLFELLLTATLCFCLFFCTLSEQEPLVENAEDEFPSILLVTLDTTRGDRVGYTFAGVKTPILDRLAEEGRRYDRAYTTVPMTLPAHTSMLTGTYAWEHGVHENARYLGKDLNLLPTRMKKRGYKTAAFVSAYPLAKAFGLSLDFSVYDDSFPAGQSERTAQETTDLALGFLNTKQSGPIFLWVHYFDPHAPYTPPEPYKSQHPDDPYSGEIAFMDAQMGRLLDAFRRVCTDREHKVLVVGDHGEGLGDHGEALHGSLLYEGCMHVPLVIAGTGIEVRKIEEPVSIRRVFHTVLNWAGDDDELSLLNDVDEIVMGEAMKPYLQYGWQPQVMAVDGKNKIIQSGEIEIFDVVADPEELRDLSDEQEIPAACLEALENYPIPGFQDHGPTLTQEQEEKLAGLGYISSGGVDSRRSDGPNPKDMTHLFADLDRASTLFIKKQYAEAAAVFDRILDQDPGNLMVCVQLAIAHSLLDHEKQAMDFFHKAQNLAPDSIDLKHYLAMHHFRLGQHDVAAELFEEVLQHMPDRLPAIEGLITIKRNRGQIGEAVSLLKRAIKIKGPDPDHCNNLGDMNMALRDTRAAIDAYENARNASRDAFTKNLELGVCYLEQRRFEDARDCLDFVDASHPQYALALFKRAQVSVLLNEPDASDRIRFAFDQADEISRQLILNEPLFQPFGIQ